MTKRPPLSRAPGCAPAVRRTSCVLMLLLPAASCLVDPDAPCGKNQELSDESACICNADSEPAPEGGRCIPKQTPEGWGNDCLVSADTCPSPLACHADTGDDGYCTIVGCNDSDDCHGGYACDLSASVPFCLAPPSGLGEACTDDADCAGYEATYCYQGLCNIENCDLVANDCFTGLYCCDASALGARSSICVPEEYTNFCANL